MPLHALAAALALGARLTPDEAQRTLKLHHSGHNMHGCKFKDHEQCYGELTDDGMERLVQTLTMASPGSPCALTPNSVFFDVGSGYGRLAMYVRMRTDATRVVGVEVNACRHQQAMLARARLEQKAAIALDGLRLHLADVRPIRSDQALPGLCTRPLPNPALLTSQSVRWRSAERRCASGD